MDQTENPKPPKPHPEKEYEDPHFHDDDLEPPEEGDHRRASLGPRKRVRRIPPPPRRRLPED
jgi:hypothetical protein